MAKRLLQICETWARNDTTSMINKVATAFPEVYHDIKYWQDCTEDTSIAPYNSNITYHSVPLYPDMLDFKSRISSPHIIMAYDLKPEAVYGEHPYEWLNDFPIISVYTKPTWPWIPSTNRHVFISADVQKNYDNIKDRMGSRYLLDITQPLRDQLLPIFWDIL